jgi:hypothetical protein
MTDSASRQLPEETNRTETDPMEPMATAAQGATSRSGSASWGYASSQR